MSSAGGSNAPLRQFSFSSLPPFDTRRRAISSNACRIGAAYLIRNGKLPVEWWEPMTIILPLKPQEEARLAAIAQARGVSSDSVKRWIKFCSPLPTNPRHPGNPRMGFSRNTDPARRKPRSTITVTKCSPVFPALISDDCRNSRYPLGPLVPAQKSPACQTRRAHSLTMRPARATPSGCPRSAWPSRDRLIRASNIRTVW